MAYMFQNDEDLQRKLAGTPPAGAGTNVSTGGGVISGAGGGQVAKAEAPKPTSFVGINDYLKANTNQAAGLANKVAGNITNQAVSAENDINSARDKAAKSITDQGVGTNQTLLNTLASDPTKADADAIKKMANASTVAVTKPAEITDTDSVKKLREQVSNLGSEEGRRLLVNDAYNAPQRSKSYGTSLFDNMLLATDPNAKKTLATAAKNVEPITNDIAAANASLGKTYDDTVAKNAATSAAARTAINNAVSNFGTTFNTAADKRLADIRSANTGAVSRFKAAVAGKNASGLSDNDLKLLGLDRATANKFVNDPNAMSQVLGLQPGDMNTLTRAAVATPEERARMKALANIAGLDPSKAAFDWNLTSPAQTDFVTFNPNFTPEPVLVPASAGGGISAPPVKGPDGKPKDPATVVTSGGSGSQAMIPQAKPGDDTSHYGERVDVNVPVQNTAVRTESAMIPQQGQSEPAPLPASKTKTTAPAKQKTWAEMSVAERLADAAEKNRKRIAAEKAAGEANKAKYNPVAGRVDLENPLDNTVIDANRPTPAPAVPWATPSTPATMNIPTQEQSAARPATPVPVPVPTKAKIDPFKFGNIMRALENER